MKSFLATALMSQPFALVNGACSDTPAYVGKQKFASEVNRIILPGVTSIVVDMHGACEKGECVGTERGGLTDANIAAAAAAVQARTAAKFPAEIVSTKLKPISKHIPDPNKPTKGWMVQWGSFIHKSIADEKISEVVFSYGGWTFGEDTHFAAYWVVPQRTDIPTECQ